MWRDKPKARNKNAHQGEFLMTFYRHLGLDLPGARTYFLDISFVCVVESSSYRWIHSSPGGPDTAASQAGWFERWTLTFQLWKSIRTLSSYCTHLLQSLTRHQQIKLSLDIICRQQGCFPPSQLKSLIWRTKEVACTALSTAKPWDSHLQFPYSSTDVQMFLLFPIHILEEHHLVTYTSSKHPFFPFYRCLSLESVASTQKQEPLVVT